MNRLIGGSLAAPSEGSGACQAPTTVTVSADLTFT